MTTNTKRDEVQVTAKDKRLAQKLEKDLQKLAWKYEKEGQDLMQFEIVLLNSALSLTFQIYKPEALAHIHGLISTFLEDKESV